MVWIGVYVIATTIGVTDEPYREDPLDSLWNPTEDGRRRSLELVFDFASRPGTGYQDLVTKRSNLNLAFQLDKGGVLELPSRLVDLEVLVRVRKEEEKLMWQRVEELEEWMKKLVVVDVG